MKYDRKAMSHWLYKKRKFHKEGEARMRAFLDFLSAQIREGKVKLFQAPNVPNSSGL